MVRIAAVVFWFLLVSTTRDFQKGDELQVKVNELSSMKKNLRYDFYDLRYCRPVKIRNFVENLREVLGGDRIKNSVYSFRMRKDEPCTIACRIVLDAQGAKDFKEKIDDEYRANMILDNLPVAVRGQRSYRTSTIQRSYRTSTIYAHGFRVGFRLELRGNYTGGKEYKYFLNNHLSFTVKYHRDPKTDSSRIVGFEVTPSSIEHKFERDGYMKASTCNQNTKNILRYGYPHYIQEVDAGKEITFSYDVTFEESEIEWASRWDAYILMDDYQIHWFSIINSLLIPLLLSCTIAMIMIQTLYKDIASYNQLEAEDEAREETGWKLVHGDVFRPPANSELLCVFAGAGVQIAGMMLAVMFFAFVGFTRRGLMTTMALPWALMGFFGGYASARLYKMFNGEEWRTNALKTALLFPGLLFAVSSWAVPFGTMLALVFLWFGISVPLVFVGGYFGFRKIAIQVPTGTYKIPRQIPDQPWYLTRAFSVLIGGILPFGVVFIELFFVLTPVWLNRLHYLAGFLVIVFVILMIVCVETAIVLCYFQLCSEDYNWWWRAYLNGGSSALYLLLYSVFYFFTRLGIGELASVVSCFGYVLVVSCAIFVLTGTVGFYACFWFVRTIYSSVKIE